VPVHLLALVVVSVFLVDLVDYGTIVSESAGPNLLRLHRLLEGLRRARDERGPVSPSDLFMSRWWLWIFLGVDLFNLSCAHRFNQLD